MNNALEILRSKQSLSEKQMVDTMHFIMTGQAIQSDIEAFLSLLSQKGETVCEITGAVRALRKKAFTIKAPDDAVDCCGTGGDKKGTYNISTAVAIVSAACGVPMAKHGNRASSSKSGAADVLEALGVNLDAPQAQLEKALEQLNFAFLMAPNHHKAMVHVAQARKNLKHRTIFNILGPLLNPAGTQLQLMGVYDKALVRPIAEVLRNLGARRAWVVCGADGLDEITTTDKTHVAILEEDGNITEKDLSPKDFSISYADERDLIGGSAQYNAKALMSVLQGNKSAYRDIVLANTAAVLCIYGSVQTLVDGVSIAKDALDSGKALEVLNTYIQHTQTKA